MPLDLKHESSAASGDLNETVSSIHAVLAKQELAAPRRYMYGARDPRRNLRQWIPGKDDICTHCCSGKTTDGGRHLHMHWPWRNDSHKEDGDTRTPEDRDHGQRSPDGERSQMEREACRRRALDEGEIDLDILCESFNRQRGRVAQRHARRETRRGVITPGAGSREQTNANHTQSQAALLPKISHLRLTSQSLRHPPLR